MHLALGDPEQRLDVEDPAEERLGGADAAAPVQVGERVEEHVDHQPRPARLGVADDRVHICAGGEVAERRPHQELDAHADGSRVDGGHPVIELLCGERRRLQGSAQLLGDVDAEHPVAGLAEQLAVHRREVLGRRLGGGRRDAAPGEARVEGVGVEVDAVAELLLTEAHGEGHDPDPEGRRLGGEDVGGAVGDDVQHGHSRERM